MDTIIVLFNRDLRVHDHPALAAAHAEARRVVPLFVLDPAVPSGRRGPFLLDCLDDLRASLRTRGGDLLVRDGDVVTETMRLARETSATAIYTSDDVSALARDRARRFDAERIEFRTFPGVTIVEPGRLTPSGGGDHYRVFTPYWRAWSKASRRDRAKAPSSITLPPDLAPGTIPEHPSALMPGGESKARARLRTWTRHGMDAYADTRDALADDGTSKLSPYLRFGCLSPLEIEAHGSDEFARQLCWRDFFHQVTRAFPAITSRDYRPRGHRWRHDPAAERAWREGTTGVPIVDAGMRQLVREGWMHNRARMITASYLVRHLHLDWRLGARHFQEHLLDGDVPNNYGNWQWTAGTGNDTRPNRAFNPIRQSKRFDPDAVYIRRYVPELADVPDGGVHEPWTLPAPPPDYPRPLSLGPPGG